MPNPTHIAARPTTYKGVEMRSRLEARYAQWLDAQGLEWTYEPRCFASDDGQYLPDFQIDGVRVLGSVHPIFVEVKPNFDYLKRSDHCSWSRIINASIPDAFFVVEVESTICPLVTAPQTHGGFNWRGAWTRSPEGVELVFQLIDHWRDVY